jgi:hypothetical protein
MTINTVSEGTNLLTDLLGSEGTQISQIVIINPYTGQESFITTEESVQFVDNRPMVLRRVHPIMGGCGDPIFNPNMVSFCAILQIPFCKLHMITCPYCGRNVSLLVSQIMDINGVILRVCRDCVVNARVIPLFSSHQIPLLP